MAQARLAAALALAPDHPGALLARCSLHAAAADWRAALPACEAVLPVDPVEGHLALGRVHLELDDPAKAEAAFAAALAIAPDDPRPHLGRALLAARAPLDTGDLADHLRRAFAAAPDMRLETLLVQPGWEPVAADPQVQATLQALLLELSQAP